MTPETWERAKPLLKRALRYQDTHSLMDVRDAILREEAQIWCGRSSVIVTELHTHPRKRECRIWLAAGDKNELVSEMLPEVEEWAKMKKCKAVSVVGRAGWTRVLAGYKQPHRVLEKVL